MVEKAEDTIYQGIMYHGNNPQEFSMWRILTDNNPAMALAVHNGADVSIDTQ